jgi:hypothetical protein
MQTQLQRNPKSDLYLLLQAKSFSDARNYHEKNKILRNMMTERPEDFLVDSSLNRRFVGVTHVPTSFKVHAPLDIVPSTVKRQENMDKSAANDQWRHVPALMAAYVKSARFMYEKIARALLPGMQVWLSPVSEKVLVDSRLGRDSGDVSTALEKAGVDHKPGRPNLEYPWVMVKRADSTRISSIVGPVAQAMAIKPSKFTNYIGGATPLASMLAGGTLAAGLGYGAGAIAETVAPEVFQKNTLRKRLATLGGVLGAAPGAALGFAGMHTWNSPHNPHRDRSSWNAFTSPNVLYGNPPTIGRPDISKSAAALKAVQPAISEEMQKVANMFAPFQDQISLSPIPVDSFNRLVMADPFTPPPLQSATMGLVGAADSYRGNSGFITPMDIARVGLGMGAGYVQATIGGKVLGALAGLTPQAQKSLQSAGVVAGALKSVVPGMFGQ